ncbi:MAG: HEAT repeat domain-containing protein [Gemmataceae bacterium]
MPDLPTLLPHIRALVGGDAAARRRALQDLKELADRELAAAPPAAVHSLVESLRQHLRNDATPAPERRQVVAILDKLGSRAAPVVPQLIELLQAAHPIGTREAAAAALGRIGPEAGRAVDPLIELVSGDRASLVVRAVRALGDIGDGSDRVRAALIGLWQSPSQTPGLNAELAAAMCKLGIDAPGLVRFLTNALAANAEVTVRKLAAEALAWRNSEETDVVPALLRAAVSDKDEDVRRLAEAALVRLRLSREEAVGVTATQLLASPHAEAALRHSGGMAAPALAEVLKTGKPAAREKAAWILCFLGESAAAAAPALRNALRAKDPGLRLAAAKALWSVSGDAGAVTPVLIDLLHANWGAGEVAIEVRRRALQTVMEALRGIGPSAVEAIPALTEMSKDKSRLISESARNALKEITRGMPNTEAPPRPIKSRYTAGGNG